MDINKIKRQSSLNESLDINVKKRRTIPLDKKPITSFENLSNEIFYEIFDYLDGYDICNAFSDLNFRIQQLITSSSCRLKVTFHEQSNLEIKHYCTHVMFPKRQQIMSLIFWDTSLIDEVFKYCIIDSLFNRLESIRIWEISFEKLITYLYYFKSLPRLSSLLIWLEDDDYHDLSELYRMIFYLPCLKYNHLAVLKGDIDASIPIAINTRFSTIEYLVLTHNCHLYELISILYHTPRLHHLICRELLEIETMPRDEVLLSLPYLTYIKFDELCHGEFYKFEKFLKQICDQAQVLHIDKFKSTQFIYPDHWQQFILQNMSHLRQFHFSLYLHVDSNFKDFQFEKYINQVTSPFWIDHEWIFKLFIDSEETCCDIRPYKKLWFKPDRFIKTINYSNQDVSFKQQTTDQTSIEFRQNIEFNFISRYGLNWNPSFMDKLHPMLLAIQINSLCLDNTKMPVSTFLILIHRLPNLDLLKIKSLPLSELKELSNEDTENLRSVSKCNKITKVCQGMNMDLTTFLITLCPRIEHLEITETINTQLEKLVEFILVKNLTVINHLNSLQFCGENMNDEIVDELKKIIDSENLLFNYIIKRFGNYIILKWKLVLK